MAHFVYPVPANAQPGSAVQVTTASHSYAYSAASTPAVNTYTSAYNNPTTTQSSISGDTTLRTTGAKTEEVKAAPEPAAAAKPAEPVQTSSDDCDTTLRTTGAKTEEVKAAPEPAAAAKPAEPMQTPSDDLKDDEHLNILGEKDVAHVGHEYIEEVRNEQGKTVCFYCKLCECNFNDTNAKEMHLKGRRHRMQYKKKVDPNLQVEMKPSIRARKVQEDKLRNQAQKKEFWRRREQETRLRVEMRKEEERYWKQHRRSDMGYMHRGPMGMMGPRGPFGAGPGPMHNKRRTCMPNLSRR